MLNVVSNAKLDELERQAAIEEEALADELAQPALDGIAGHINKCWEAARNNKQIEVKERLLYAKRARRGEYDAQKLAAIRQLTGGSEEYGRIVSNKCRIAEAWLRDVYLGQAEKAWVLRHTPVPELSEESQQEVQDAIQKEIVEAVAIFGQTPPGEMINARKNEMIDAIRMRMNEEAKLAVERMEDKMADQMTEAGFHNEWADFLNDFVTYPAAHFKGPIYRKRTELKWKQKGGQWVPVPVEEVVPTFQRVDPFRAYPAPGATSPQDGYWIEHIELSRSDLYDLIGVDGYSEEAIRAILTDGGGYRNWLGLTDADEEEAENGSLYLSPDEEIDALEYYGPVRGKDLVTWGVPKSKIDDEDRDYEVTAWLIGRHVIKVQLNPNPLGIRPIYKGCWEEVPGEYWGQGLPDGLRDVEGVTNAAIRSLVNNMGMASGPQVAVNVDRLPPGEDIESLTPWKIWQIQDSQYGSTAKAIEFFQPNINANEILTVLEKFYQFADDWSLIPRYMGGSDSIAGGIGRTASGMSMLFNAANKGLKGVVSSIDYRVLTPMLGMLYSMNMMFEEDTSIKGDAQIEARGAVALMQLETLQLRRNEFLQATANPLDSQIVGPEGRSEILREVAKGLEMDVNRVVPMRGNVGAMPGQAPMGPNGQQPISEPNKEQLFTGAAVTDNFSNNNMRSPV